MSILKKYPDRVCIHFAVDYPVQLAPAFAQAASSLNAQVSPTQLGVTPSVQYVYRKPADRTVVVLRFNRLYWKALGFNDWYENWEKYCGWVTEALKTMAIEKVTRFGFKVTAYLPLDMSHEEMCQLMFGSFLGDAESLADVLGAPKDPMCYIEGTFDPFDYYLSVTPKTPKQSSEAFRVIPDLAQFLEDPYSDTGIRDFEQRICDCDCFCFDIDLYKKDVTIPELRGLFKTSLATSQDLASRCVNFLQSKPVGKR